MDTLRCALRFVILLALLAGSVFSPAATLRAAAEGRLEDIVSSSYGTFDGVEYMKHEGRLAGLSTAAYSAYFEIVAPQDPAQGAGVVVVEALHPMGAAVRDSYITPEALNRGFTIAAVRWHPDEVDPFEGYSTEEAVEILSTFARTLREGPEARDLIGEVQHMYATGISKATEPLLSLLHSPEGGGLFDLWFLFVPWWAGEHAQPPNTGKVMVFLTESDFVLSAILGLNTQILRGDSPTYRTYEIAGGPHVPNSPEQRAIEMWAEELAASTPLDWAPVAQALFWAGHRWAAEGLEPPPSAMLAQATAGEVDPVYQAEYGLELETGIARDGDGNALGGIRLPDVALGRGQFIATNPGSFFGWGLFGDFKDLECEPLPDGSPRFRNHGAYVSQFAHQAESLVEAGFLLPEDAERMIAEAASSQVGKPGACPVAALPMTGMRGSSGPALDVWAAPLVLTLMGAGLGLRQWVTWHRS